MLRSIVILCLFGLISATPIIDHGIKEPTKLLKVPEYKSGNDHKDEHHGVADVDVKVDIGGSKHKPESDDYEHEPKHVDKEHSEHGDRYFGHKSGHGYGHGGIFDILDIKDLGCCPFPFIDDLCKKAGIDKICGSEPPEPVCTPNLQECAIDDPGTCCSQCCQTFNTGGLPAVCCDLDPPQK